MRVRSGGSLFVLAALLSFPPNALAVGLRSLTFEQQVAEAEVVVLAKAAAGFGRNRYVLDKTGQLELIEMDVLRVLKGDHAVRRLPFVIRGEIEERNPDCCDANTIYLLLLRQRGEHFEALNGYQSAIIVAKTAS